MGRKIRFYLLFLIVLIVLTVSAIALDQSTWERVHTDQMVAFQRMVGGVGMGAISTPIWNFINFDPRSQPIDDSTLWPIPGGYSYGPDRTATVSYFEEIPVNQLLISPLPPPSPPRGEEKGERK
ncbi:MAG: hypothetical protein ACXWM6_05100 [Thermodesulfobacteriota bacterium]